ncbi:unnamed protein product [Chilo suppressalis]|uniref:Uncharacterized protein n=1 Tax=Chilo suppressalis TaxID=168631 RepID=A0ABN8BHL6_CHISP|nr:hypothetical protein evm_001205 [Chilo suppressalis]CAH0407419.1 unnamed protein product [Chilo suppressalis]
MEIRNRSWYIIFNCALIPLVVAKTFSLNDALAAESQLKTSDLSSPISTETTAHRFSLNRAFTTDTPRKLKLDKFLSDKLPLSKYNKSPFKAKKARHILRPFHIKSNAYKKREIFKNDKTDKKYFPLLKNLGLLLDNLLNSEPVESYEVSKRKQKRHKYQPEKRPGFVCKCALQSDSEVGDSKTNKKTTVLTKTIPTEKPATAATSADPTVGDISGVGQNKELPLLLPRDSPGNRRDSYGHDERSRSTLHGSFERNIPRNIRNRKHNSRIENDKSSAQRDEKVTYSYPRDDASSDEYRRRQYRGNADIQVDRRAASKRKEFEEDEKDNDVFGRDSYEKHTREIQLKVGRNETKSENLLPEYVRRYRRPVPETEDGDIAKPLQSKKDYEESINNVSFDNTSDQRITSRSSTSPTEAKETSARNENMISFKDLSNLDLAFHKSPKFETPSVTIIDGYSVASDKNGKNKLTEKTIHIHT